MIRKRKGFVMVFLGRLFPLNRYGRPVLFRSRRVAERVKTRYPAWGHDAVQITRCTVVYGTSKNGLPDYVVRRRRA